MTTLSVLTNLLPKTYSTQTFVRVVPQVHRRYHFSRPDQHHHPFLQLTENFKSLHALSRKIGNQVWIIYGIFECQWTQKFLNDSDTRF